MQLPWQQQGFFHTPTATARPLIACSACLQGEAVRYDGRHKRQDSIVRWLNPHLQVESLCPEVAIGQPVPRPPVQLVASSHSIRARGVDNSNLDISDELKTEGHRIVGKVGSDWPLCAYIFKSRSPSCGVGSTPIFDISPHAEKPDDKLESHLGSGLYAQQIKQQLPWLPLFEEWQLQTEAACQRALFYSFLCHDIVWSTDAGELDELVAHYSSLLAEFDSQQQLAAVEYSHQRQLMQAVCGIIETLQQDQQRQLVGSFLGR